jgi:hypothetical protein
VEYQAEEEVEVDKMMEQVALRAETEHGAK